MVQVSALTDEEYLTPLTSIYDILLDPEQQTQFTPSKLQALLIHHLNKLNSPTRPFSSPSTSSRQALKSNTVNVPHTSVSLDVSEKNRKLAYQLSQRADIDEVEALILYRTCNDEESTLDRLTLWYAEEALAAPRLVMALQRLSQRGLDEWSRIAGDVLTNIITDEAKYIETIFRAWSSVAQKPLEGVQRSDQALFWGTLQLRLQNELLDLLFLVLYDYPDRPASISLGLLRGVVASAFGTLQGNREIWNTDDESQMLQQRIRDRTLIIALEAMCLSTIVTPLNKDDMDAPVVQAEGTLLRSRDAIISIDVLLNTESQNLVPQSPEPDLSSMSFPSWPMPVLCLAWSIVLRNLPNDLQPPPLGYERPIFEEFAVRALRLPSGLFPWLEEILSGPLLTFAEEDEETPLDRELSIWRRKVVKDLLMGLSDLVQIQHIVDRTGLYRVWDLLFGGGSPSTSLAVAEDYWEADHSYANRSAPLDDAQFPVNAARLPLLLSALSGAQSPSPLRQTTAGTSPAISVFDYLLQLPTLTIRTDPSHCSFLGGENSDRRIVEARKDSILPGVLKIRAGSRGEVMSPEDSKTVIVRWDGPFAAWGLLVEITRAAAGIRPMDQKDGFTPEDANFAHLTIGDLGLEGDSREILASNLQLLRVILHPSLRLSSSLLGQIRSGDQPASVHILELAITVLDGVRRNGIQPTDYPIAKAALSIIQSLLYDAGPVVWTALHHSSFFGALGKRRSIAADIIDADSIRGDHSLTLAVLRLVAALAASTNNTVKPDDTVVRSALQLVVSSVWLPSSGWRFQSVSGKYRIISILSTIFTMILQHPLDGSTSRPTLAAQYLLDTFVTSSSMLTYRPTLEVLSQAPTLATSLLTSYRTEEARAVVQTLDCSLTLMSTLLRVANNVEATASSLPKSLFAAPVVSASGNKVQAIQIIFGLANSAILPNLTRLNALATVRTYLETSSTDATRPSLAGLLHDAETSFRALAELATDESPELRSAVWNLLSTVLTHQPGCAHFCTGSQGDNVDGVLLIAVNQILDWQAVIFTSPRSISAVLAYLNAVLLCPGATKAVAALRRHTQVWSEVYDIAIRTVPAPPTFTLSMHSETFANRIQAYAFAVRAKSGAVSLLASELALSLQEDDDGPETKGQSLITGLFRNTTALTELALSAAHSSCLPQLHEEHEAALQSEGLHLASIRTLLLPSEREFGPLYLYDGEIRVSGDESRQAAVNLALDMLNLNWSMLEADLNLTKAFNRLADSAYSITEGDALASAASLRAGTSIAELLANEDRGGDVMLAIQNDRLVGLSALLETALASENAAPSHKILAELCSSVRQILESQAFPPMIGLRHPDLPAIHKPLLRIVHSIVQAFPALESSPSVLEPILETAMSFTLDAADTVLDSLVRDSAGDLSLTADLEQVVGIICEIVRSPMTHLWMDKLSEHDLIPRSLELTSRLRISDDHIQPHIASILLLHLALAGNPSSAEKLAVSGILPTYSDNAIILLAEQAKIIPSSPSPQPNSVHGAWCTMLWVVHGILTSLPHIDAGALARSDVIPFLRVCTNQILRALSWNGETTLSLPILDELSQVTNVIYALVQVIGSNDGLLDELSVPLLSFLKSVRYSLSHPRLFSTLMSPSSEEERMKLEKELSSLSDDQEPKILDVTAAPALAARTLKLLGATRSSVMALLTLTQGWATLQSDSEESQEDLILSYDEDPSTAADDPVGVLNDLLTQVSKFVDALPLSSSEPEVLAARSLLNQLEESIALLSTSQMVLRHLDQPQMQQHHEDIDMNNADSSFDKESVRRRISMANAGSGDRAENIQAELIRDLLGTLSGLEDGNELIRWLSGVAEQRLGMTHEA
ncbi:hypothetical protein BD324DRAFT_588209 [Kockovaella imperatae]|uniref:Nucleoporin Nup188 N-terminal subdomain III domain-containing protein n=1 Tax=Kockovaella imperatae TaxID=4999 RepID=A0A1Y1UP70_9TREE|nr:hypothetical protein BD324DRAFT_588209 [Kockovaella imperatae]ORX39314.1 hypothetical protein BD324DRAFT_588209 [Kockovaella imperatae]